MSDLAAALGGLALERQPDGRFLARGGVPPWCVALDRGDVRWDEPFVADELFPYLSVFLPDAEAAWRDEHSARADSGFWTETDRSGSEIHLEASAVRVGATAMLVITRAERLFAEEQRLLQRARELRLTHDALMREVQAKDILVHTIVHDLAAPLHSIMGVLSLLSEQGIGPPGDRWIELALTAATRQRELIEEILDVYAGPGPGSADAAAAGVGLASVLERVIAERAPVARLRDVGLESEMPEPPVRVVGEPLRLFRVLTNLLDNAFRYAPSGTVVRISTHRKGDVLEIDVEDRGPGVLAEVVPRLFDRLARGGERGGSGLGLFFCRITVEAWGGAIGYAPRDGGGARFWIRLPVVGERSTAHGEGPSARR